MALLTEEMFRRSLNATSVLTGSVALSTTAAPLSDAATAFTGGITLVNADASIMIWISTTPDNNGVITAVANDPGSFPLIPGAPPIRLAVGDLAKIYAIAESGTPRIGWTGATL